LTKVGLIGERRLTSNRCTFSLRPRVNVNLFKALRELINSVGFFYVEVRTT
jgi:hypothetical protein